MLKSILNTALYVGVFSSVVGYSLGVNAQQIAEDYKSAKRFNLSGQVTGLIDSDPDGNGQLGFPAVRNTYEAGQLTKVEKGYLVSWQNETIAPSNWSSFNIQSATEIEYNSKGQKILELVRGKDGNVYSRKEYNYDSRSRVICEATRMNPANFDLTYNEASVCLLQTAGEFGEDRIKYFEYDNFNNVRKEVRGYRTSLEHDYVQYTYEKTYLIKTVEDANGNIAEMEYDNFGRKTKWKFPDKYLEGQVNDQDYEEYDYDDKGNRTYLKKRDGSEIYFHHDNLDRVVHKDFVDVGEKDVFYRYDLRDLQTEAYFFNNGSKISTAYNGFGELISETNKVGGVYYPIAHQYDENGNRERSTYFDGEYFTYFYDGLDRLSTIKENDSSILIASLYNNFSQPESQSTAGNVKTTLEYDDVGRVENVDLAVSGNSYDLKFGFTYNPESQIASQNLSNSNYDYSGSGGKTGTYNVNRLNQYETVDGAQFYHDENGNLTHDGSRDYIYDAENRLIYSIDEQQDVTLEYDPNGRLVSYDVDGAITNFIYSGDNLIAEVVGGVVTKRYVHASNMGTPLVQYDGSEVGSANREFLHTNHQGSVISATASNGFTEYVNTYDAYGVPGSGNQGRFAYTGQMYLPELGLYHYRARVYDPGIGRFLQTDPVGYEDQVNLYSYVANDPFNHTDPSGEFLNFVAKFATDVALGAALNYLETGEVNITGAVKDAATGLVNPAKTIQKAKRVANLVTKLNKTCCFVAGTQVLTESGYKNIEDVKLGENLWAKNVETGEQGWKPVTKIFIEPDREIYEILLIGVDGFIQTIEATDDHPFFVFGKGWAQTVELVAGDYVETDGIGSMMVVSVIDEERFDLTYNFTVADFHTYYVTERKVLVHNCSVVTKDAARKQVMKEQGIPTSQQPISQSKNASGREYQYEVPKPGGGTQIKSVQQQTLDRSHPGQGHWEAGTVKTDPLTGQVRMNDYGRPKLGNDKSKVDYDD